MTDKGGGSKDVAERAKKMGFFGRPPFDVMLDLVERLDELERRIAELERNARSK